jgi:hypothetical protein
VRTPSVAASSASSAWTSASGAAAIPFRRDDDAGFPVGGAALLVVLLAAAVWAWWYGRTRGVRGTASSAPAWAWLRRPASGSGGLKVLESTQAAPGVRLMVVEWDGGKVLVGVNGASAPVALDRSGGSSPGKETH